MPPLGPAQVGSGTAGSTTGGATAGGATAGTTPGVNDAGMAGSNVPPVSEPEGDDDGGCQMARSSGSNHGPTALLLLVLGLASRSRTIARGIRGR